VSGTVSLGPQALVYGLTSACKRPPIAYAPGFAFAEPETIRERFGKSISENYPGATPEFLAVATSYWTLKQVHWNLFRTSSARPLAQLTSWLEEMIGAVFFPMPGPLSVSPEVRVQTQRSILRKTGATINEERFIAGNPILKRRSAGCLGVVVAIAAGMIAVLWFTV